ncbi:efflux transporter outer membrane subunit [Variovorax sp. NFACC27]|uniref:efflux transporter outer membrane subunit n=1 Tax=unclassified Variovorax TaxID=663243 RepID=UPI00089AD0BB|nr:efflux transporter, outer membrane factor (OMF) lipoprotein, NodT family [Variovorax sp. NFACC28]SEG98222.1 efflux transporter, outer membrane factor (OMF) lipoprotein, NodT family [Variovorax sp. NFACC29]SFE05724.1 efflux transporter, outer membrane factor (OMF) lipoprotein, NodT family [Variovorax sp. NFACC26]SFH13470.1 efflux transporter, outer membrane factor (OMF) lipoprotein, NodT family [Variovorax sp. NFACC27]
MATRLFTVLVLGAASLVLAACATRRTYSEPVLETPPAWQAVLPHGGSVGAMRDWWRQFDDPVVAQLTAIAESDSPSLVKAWAAIEKARATLTTSQASGLPSLDGSASVTRARQQSVSGALATTTTRSAGLDAAWEIDLFGKVRNNIEAAEARAGARVADWHDARVSLAAEVVDTYVQYRGCELLVDAYERERVSTAKTERATAVAVRAGFSSESDAALARASLASTTSTLLSQRAQCDLLVKSLVDLTGRDEQMLRSLLSSGKTGDGTGSGRLPLPAGLEVQSVPANVLRQRPDLASLERELAASSAEIGVAQADLYPSLSLSGSISVSATPGASALTTWSLGPSLSIPLFDGGKRRAAVVTARANYQTALANYRQGVRTAVKEVERSLVNLDSTARRVDEAQRAADDYRRYFQATETNWRAGLESLLTLEEARRSALSAEISLITLQRDRVEYWISLYKALGGGWQAGASALPASQTGGPVEASKSNS